MNDRIRFVVLIVSFFQIKKMRPKKALNLFKVYQLVGDTAKTGCTSPGPQSWVLFTDTLLHLFGRTH